MESSLNLIFDPSEDVAVHWAARSGVEHALDLRTAEQLYTRAIPYIKNWAWALAAKHGWTEEAVDTVGDMPLAVCLGRDELVQGVNGDRTYVARLVLPLHFSDFLDPEFSNDWAAMFSHLMTSYQSETDNLNSADIFQLGRAGIPRPLQNILYLLQILSPGLLVVRSLTTDDYEDEDGEWGAQGLDLALPPSIWVGLHIEDLEDIFGAQTALKLYQAAEDPYCASEETTSYDGSYGSQGASEQFSDSSDSAFAFDSSEDDWSNTVDATPLEFGHQADEGDYLQYTSVPYSQSKEIKMTLEALDMSKFDVHDEYNNHQLISDNMDGGGKTLDMEYRHCDSDCNFCGLCSSHFANRLSERLLMHVL